MTDPYSVALTLNSTRSVAVDLSDPGLAARASGNGSPSPVLKQDVDSSIYELHVRDFSVGDTSVPAAHRGSYLAFADDGDGTKHLKALAAAGLNTVHLLPTFDIASIEEDPARQARPACDLAVVRAGQRAAAEVRHRGGRQGRLQLGLRPLPLDGARGVLRLERQDRGRRLAGGRVPHHGGRPAP